MNEIILREREVREEIAEILNKSNLPAIILKPILLDFLQVIKTLENQEYEQAKKRNETMEEKE